MTTYVLAAIESPAK